MDLNGDLADAQSLSDLLVEQPARDEREYLALPQGQSVVLRAQLPELHSSSSRSQGFANGETQRPHEVARITGHYQKIDGPGLECPDARRDTALASQEQDGCTSLREILLQLQAICVRQLDVEDRAGWSVRHEAVEKPGSRIETLGRQARRDDGGLDPPSHGCICVHDEHGWFGGSCGSHPEGLSLESLLTGSPPLYSS